MTSLLSARCFEPWGSVRKVRYREDILSTLKYVAENENSVFIPDVYRKYLLEGRRRRLTLIMKHFRAAFYTPVLGVEKKRLKITIPDTLAFFKKLGLVSLDRNVVRPTSQGKFLYQIWGVGDLEGESEFLRVLFDSGYRAYSCFLQTLSYLVTLPTASLGERTPAASARLKTMGFATDIASFFTIKDLFYEFGLCNWLIDKRGLETLYATAAFTTDENNEWVRHVKLQDGVDLLMWRKITAEQFETRLRQSYLGLSGDRFGISVRLLELRDEVCAALLISDQQFNALLNECKLAFSKKRITLSFGTVIVKKRNYAQKVSTLPMVSPNRAAMFLTMDE